MDCLLFPCTAATAPHVNIERSSDGRDMTVSWVPLTLVEARGFVQYYVITISEAGSITKRQLGGWCAEGIYLAPAASDSLTVTGLNPSTGYGVAVAAVNRLQSPPRVPPDEIDENLVALGNSSDEQTVEG